MRAVGVNEFGGPEKLEVVDIPEPHPRQGEVRIHVHAATVNPTDTGIRVGMYGRQFAAVVAERQPPFVPGSEAAGIISEVGADTDWKVGDEVIAIVVPYAPPDAPYGGAYAEEVVVPQESVVRKPAGIDFFHAATLPMNGLTALLTIDTLGLRPGQTIAVTGAAGAYGGYVVQLAKAAGLVVIADSSEQDEAIVESLGADVVVRRGDHIAERIRAVVPGGVDGLADGAVQHEKTVAAIRDHGRLAVIRGWRGDPGRGITVHPIVVYNAAKDTASLEHLARLAQDGTLTLRVARTFRPEEAGEAHRLLQAGGIRGRMVIDFSS
jgi:NADPH2:quinone reductase